MTKYYYGLLGFLLLVTTFACKKDRPSITGSQIPKNPLIVIDLVPDQNPTGAIVATLYDHDSNVPNINISDALRGGNFVYRAASAGLLVDNGIVFASKSKGFWERTTGDTIKLAWYNINTTNLDNASIIRSGIQAAIDRKALVVTFPFAGAYIIKSGSYWTVTDKLKLQIAGNGATIVVDGSAALVSQETYVMAFKCLETSNSLNSGICIKDLNVRAPDIKPLWTNPNYAEHRLVIAMETDGIHTVEINNCKMDDICGYGIRLKNFVSASIDHVSENNVGGHFPIENGFDSFGDGIWLGQYDVKTKRSSRKISYAKITNSTIKGYDTGTNGNFASRSGITVEGFNSYASDIIMKVDVDNCIISDYDRNLHVEGISSNINYSNSSVRNFFGIGLIVSSANTRLTYNNCNASALLPANPLQERLGLGGVMQFNSTVDLYLNNKSVFSLNGPASFRANVHLEDNSILDLGNSDVFFDHTNLFVNTGASIINIPTKVGRGYNMYGGSVEFNGATFTAFNRERDEKAAFNGENISQASIANCKLNNTQLFFTGRFGTKKIN